MTEEKDKKTDESKQQKKGKSPEDTVAETLKLLEYAGNDRIVPAQDVWDRTRKKEGEPKPLCFSGFENMDNALKGGFFAGQLIVVSGYTGEGKSTFLRTLTREFVDQGVSPLWFSYEETDDEFLEKFTVRMLPLFYMPNVLSDKSVKWIHTRIREAKIKFDARVIFVDHLHFLVDLYKIRNPSLEIGAIVRDLKKVAKFNRVALFLVAHIAKVDRKDGELEQGDIRDSSFIEQESDTVIYVWRDKGKNDMNIAKITKNRKGGQTGVKTFMHYNAETQSYEPIQEKRG